MIISQKVTITLVFLPIVLGMQCKKVFNFKNDACAAEFLKKISKLEKSIYFTIITVSQLGQNFKLLLKLHKHTSAIL